MIFSQRNCNYPQPEVRARGGSRSSGAGAWSKARPTTRASSKKVMRADIYDEAMKEIGYAHGGRRRLQPETLFDGTPSIPTEPEEYAKSFAVNSVKG